MKVNNNDSNDYINQLDQKNSNNTIKSSETFLVLWAKDFEQYLFNFACIR
jgi:hypothetical protein